MPQKWITLSTVLQTVKVEPQEITAPILMVRMETSMIVHEMPHLSAMFLT